MWYRLIRTYNVGLTATGDPILTLRTLKENMGPTYRTLVIPLLLLSMSFSLASCTRREPQATALSTAMPHQMLAARVAQTARSSGSANTLSREHHAVVEVREGDLQTRFRRVASRCNADLADHC